MGVGIGVEPKRSSTLLDYEPLFVGDARPEVVLDDLNVFDAALERIRWLFEEFDGKVVASNSGGKDSTVVLELAAMVAKERGELPLNVYWLDQECEFQSTVDYQRYLMYERDDIKFTWYQIPFLLENSTNQDDPWLKVWGEGEEWVRPREPGSVHENRFGRKYWLGLLDSIAATDWNGWAILDGIRSEESPARRLASRSKPMYKWVTWSVGAGVGPKTPNPNGYRFHPIFDWKFQDIWKAINDNGWQYNAHYDHLFQYGVPKRSMRVSNYHHESALKSLHFLQELEPETWEAATRRLQGINTYGHLQADQYPKELPYMFSSWTEYMHYLIDNLAPNEEAKEVFRKQHARCVSATKDFTYDTTNESAQMVIKSLIGNDLAGTHIGNYILGLKAWVRLGEREKVGRARFAAAMRKEAQNG